MNDFYIICRDFNPGSAPANRLLSFLKVFEKKGIKTRLYFLYPNKSCSKIDCKYKNIEITYCWDKLLLRNYYLPKLLSSIIILLLIKNINKGDKVFLFEVPYVLNYLVHIKGIEVYQEVTEHPFVLKSRNRLGRILYIKNSPRLSGLFVISTALKEYFNSIGVDNRKIKIINITVDISRFDNIVKQENGEKYIAYCGTVTNNKDGVDDLIKSFAIVHSKHPNIKLYIIGSTPYTNDELGNTALIKRMGLTDSVIFTGRIDAEQMPQMLKNAEVLVLARPNNLQAQNGFPTKLGEYLLTENPVVVTKVGDIPLFLEDGINALLAEPCNIKEISDKICWALEHKIDASKIGKKGAEVARVYFNADIETTKIIDTIF